MRIPFTRIPEFQIFLAIILSLFGLSAFAELEPDAQRVPGLPIQQAGCQIAFEETDYLGTFYWKGNSPGMQTLRIRVGTLLNPESRMQQKVAQIESLDSESGTRCQAVCVAVADMAFSCTSATISAMNTSVLIMNPNHAETRIRVGSLSEGYQEATLSMEMAGAVSR